MAKIKIENKEVTIISEGHQDYISLSDMANAKESESRAADIIKNWLRTRFTLEFISTWEKINNPDFKVVEFDHFKTQAGLPRREVKKSSIRACKMNYTGKFIL